MDALAALLFLQHLPGIGTRFLNRAFVPTVERGQLLLEGCVPSRSRISEEGFAPGIQLELAIPVSEEPLVSGDLAETAAQCMEWLRQAGRRPALKEARIAAAQAARILEWLAANPDVAAVHAFDPRYPRRLSHLGAARPLVLYVKCGRANAPGLLDHVSGQDAPAPGRSGQAARGAADPLAALFSEPCAAVIGSRWPCAWTVEHGQAIVEALARQAPPPAEREPGSAGAVQSLSCGAATPAPVGSAQVLSCGAATPASAGSAQVLSCGAATPASAGAAQSLSCGAAPPAPAGSAQVLSCGADPAISSGQPLTILSGLARGCDALGHRGAMAADARTIAAIACGIDRVVPAMHESLAQDILAHGGAILSAYPPGVEAAEFRYLERDAMVAALSAGLLVLECGVESGTMKTVEAGAAMGRPLACLLPAGRASDAAFAGNRYMHRQYGADRIENRRQLLAFAGRVRQTHGKLT